MHTEVMKITKQIADEWLKKNIATNRKIRRDEVNNFKRLLQEGGFLLDPFGVVFDTYGNLINAQHRLTAISESGIPAEMNVTFDAPPEVIKILDTQRPRTLQQRRAMDGHANSTAEVALVKFMFRYEYGTVSRDDHIWEVLDRFDGSIKEIVRISIAGKNSGKCKKAPILAALWSAYVSGVSLQTLEMFCRAANSGFYSDDRQSSAIVFSKYIDSHPINGSQGRDELFFMAQEAINSFVKCQSRRVIWKDPKPIYYNGIPREIVLGLR